MLYANVCVSLSALSDILTLILYSILLDHSFLVFLFVPMIIYAVLCMCPHAHQCLPVFTPLSFSLALFLCYIKTLH